MEASNSHKAKITEQNRALMIILIDQSGSMNEPYAAGSSGTVHKTKAEAVAEICNALLAEIVARCRQGTTYRHYFDVSVIGYSGLGVYSALPDSTDRTLFSPSELAASVRRTEQSQQRRKTADGRYVTLYSLNKIWIEPTAEGRTPTLAAFERLTEILYSWRSSQRSLDGFPPTIINITDGEATDSRSEQLRIAAARIATLGTTDGEPLLLNVHISTNSDQSVLFPTSKDELPSEASLLFDISSVMPVSYAADIADIKGEVYAGNAATYRAVAYNASIGALIKIMNIGSSTLSRIA